MVTRSLDEVYFGENVNMKPTMKCTMELMRSDVSRDKGNSPPLRSMAVKRLGVNWQNAPKRNMAWKPSVTAALKVSQWSEGG